jgi:8-oxo-dGTP pyrophosphatase MutT (NUDIX family)
VLLTEVRERLAGLSGGAGEPAGGWPPARDSLGVVRTDGVAILMRPGPGVDTRRAAALVCIVPAPDGLARVILTERAEYEGAHASEVSFPGGREELADRGDPVVTALREAREEVGLDPAACGLEVLGRLEVTWIAASNHLVTPIVAVGARAPELVADPREVAAILQAPLEAFLPGAPTVAVERAIRGWPLRYGAFLVEGRAVWGATARILAQLGALLAR